MPALTRFQVFQVDTQTGAETQEELNDFASSAEVAEIVDWETVEADRARKSNLIIEYRPTEAA
jgi:hypothetical protein